LRDFINLQKDFYSEQQVHLEAAIAEQPQVGLFHESYERVLPFLTTEEITPLVSQVETNIVSAKKITLNRILEFIKEKSRVLKPIKI